MTRSILVNGITLLFIVLFFYTGIDKLMEIKTFRDQLQSSPLIGGFAGILTYGLPVVEIILAIILFIPRTNLIGLYATLALMTGFTIYVIVILMIDDHLSCSCGGIIEDLSPRQHVLFNITTIVLASIAIMATRRPQSTPSFRWLALSSAFLMLGLASWIIASASMAPKKTKTGFEGRLVPNFNLLLPDSIHHFNTADIPAGKPFIMIGFSPYCIHCQQETADIIKHMQRFRDTTLYYVTSFPYKDMKKFYDAFHLEKYTNIVIGVDTTDTFMRAFKASGIPYIAIFDTKRRLKEVILGQVNFNTLIRSLDD